MQLRDALAGHAAWHHLIVLQEQLRTLPAAELLREQLRLEALRSTGAAASADEAAAQTLELALVLAQPRGNGGTPAPVATGTVAAVDLSRALALAETLVRADAPAAWQAPARWLRARLAEQRRLEEQIERQAQQLREQQRRIEQLGAQLEALRAIERSLNRPPATAPARGTP